MTTDFFPRETSRTGKVSPFFVLVEARSAKPLRIPRIASPDRLSLRSDREYLRALRAAEMKAWQASGGDALNLSTTP